MGGSTAATRRSWTRSARRSEGAAESVLRNTPVRRRSCRAPAAPGGTLSTRGLRAARPGDLHAAAHGHGPAAAGRDLAAAVGPDPLPLPRHRVPRDAPAAQPQPLVHAQHHRPPRAAHRRGRDDPRGRSRARGRAPRVRAQVREPRQPELERSTARSSGTYMGHVRTMFPGFSPDATCSRARWRARAWPSPCTALGGQGRLPDMFPAPGLAMASSAHVYPEIVNGQATIGVAERATDAVLERLADTGPTAGGRVSIDSTSTALRNRRAGCRSYAQQRARDRPFRGVARRGRPRLRGARGRDLGHLGRSRPRHRVRLRGRPAHRRRAAGLPGLPVHLRPTRPRGAGGRVQLPEHLDRHGDRRGPGHGHGRHGAHLRPRAAAHLPARLGSGGHPRGHGGTGHREHRPRDPSLRLGLDGRGGFARRPPGRRGLHAERESRAPRPRRRGRGVRCSSPVPSSRPPSRSRWGYGWAGASCWPRDRRAGVRWRMPPCARASPLGWPVRPTR